MVDDDLRLALEDLVADEGVLVALLLIRVCAGLVDDVVDQLLDFLVVEAGHSLAYNRPIASEGFMKPVFISSSLSTSWRVRFSFANRLSKFLW